jgi:hypothetical protein
MAMRAVNSGEAVIVPVKLLALALVLIGANLILTVWWHNSRPAGTTFGERGDAVPRTCGTARTAAQPATSHAPACMSAAPSDDWRMTSSSATCDCDGAADDGDAASPTVDLKMLRQLIQKQTTVRSQVRSQQRAAHAPVMALSGAEEGRQGDPADSRHPTTHPANHPCTCR